MPSASLGVAQKRSQEVRDYSIDCQSHFRIEPQLCAQTTQTSLPPLTQGKDQGFSQ